MHPGSEGRRSGGGIAVVFRSHIKVEKITLSVHPASFEQLCFKATSASRLVNLVVIYRPPPRANSTFFDEFAGLWDDLANLPGELVACGDVNCPGDIPGTVDGLVGEVLQDRGLHQCVTSPTRLGNLLDVVITDPTLNIVGQVSTSNIDFSDHRLVKFDITAPIAHAAHTTFAYIKRVYLKVFDANLR